MAGCGRRCRQQGEGGGHRSVFTYAVKHYFTARVTISISQCHPPFRREGESTQKVSFPFRRPHNGQQGHERSGNKAAKWSGDGGGCEKCRLDNNAPRSQLGCHSIQRRLVELRMKGAVNRRRLVALRTRAESSQVALKVTRNLESSSKHPLFIHSFRMVATKRVCIQHLIRF